MAQLDDNANALNNNVLQELSLEEKEQWLKKFSANPVKVFFLNTPVQNWLSILETKNV